MHTYMYFIIQSMKTSSPSPPPPTPFQDGYFLARLQFTRQLYIRLQQKLSLVMRLFWRFLQKKENFSIDRAKLYATIGIISSCSNTCVSAHYYNNSIIITVSHTIQESRKASLPKRDEANISSSAISFFSSLFLFFKLTMSFSAVIAVTL